MRSSASRFGFELLIDPYISFMNIMAFTDLATLNLCPFRFLAQK